MPPQNDPLMFTYLAGLGFVTVMLAFVLIYIIVYQQKMNGFHKTLQQKELEKQFHVFEALIAGEEKERKRLAEDLHDGIGAKLSGVKMNVEYLHQQLPAEHAQHTQLVLDTLNESIDELRSISHNLQPSVIGVKGLHNALVDFVATLNRKKNTRFQLFWNANDLVFDNEQTELNVYRIGTELLSNIIKHAQATEASLQVIVQDRVLHLITEDNGIGFNQNALTSGIGLINIRNRVEHEKGKLVMDVALGRGSTIIVELPILFKA